MKPLNKLRSSLFAALCSTSTLAMAEVGCYSADVLSGSLVTNICWDCIFPIKVAGVALGGGEAPDTGITSPVCACADNAGLFMPGVTTSLWQPNRLIEFQRIPGCSSVLNGTVFPFNKLQIGTRGNNSRGNSDRSYNHYHYYAFPLTTILDIFVAPRCNSGGYSDLDIMFMSELDPTYQNDELAFFSVPESAAVANPIAVASCAADAVSSAVGTPIDSMFWCAGSWGSVYPLTGNVLGGWGILRDSSLLTARVLATLHRRGMEYSTAGTDNLCGGSIAPIVPKSQYKFTMFYPVPETDEAHTYGMPTAMWGSGRIIPGIGEDPVYVIWQWNDCCMTIE